MAFTLILLPVSLLGLVGGLLVVSYSNVAFGFAVGRRLGTDRLDRSPVAGIVLFLVVLTALQRVPIVGATVALVVTAIEIGVVLLTCFGFRTFEPVELPD